MTTEIFEARIAAVRRFSRFYTRQLGLLQESLVHTRFSLTEARVLYELAHRDQVTATALAADLDLDHGYLSRILRRFGEDGLLKKARAPDDARQSLIASRRRAARRSRRSTRARTIRWPNCSAASA